MLRKHFCTVLCGLFLLTACHHGVTIHPSKVTTEMKKEYAAALSGLYDTEVRVISSIAGAERTVKIENGKRVEYFESQDSTLQLKATILDYDNGMKLIVHNFPLSTLAPALPDSLADLRTAIAAMPDQELTIDYGFTFHDQLYMTFAPQALPFTCQTADGREHHLRLVFGQANGWGIGELEDRVLSANLFIDNRTISFYATALNEDDRPLFTFDEWINNDFFDIFLRFVERS